MAARRVNLSGVQVSAGVLATLTGAVAASYLGVGGTLVGAAIGSLASTVGGEIYRHYLERTHDRLRGAVDVRRYRAARGTVVGRADPTVAQNRLGVTSRRQDEQDAVETQVLQVPRPGEAAHRAVTASRSTSPNDPADGGAADGGEGKKARPRWLVLAAVAAGTFLIALAVITVFELSVGKTLSAAVRGQPGSGTTVGGVMGGRTAKPTPPVVKPTATATPSATPSPSSTASVVPSSAASGSPTPSPAVSVTPGGPIDPAPTPTPS
jgi:hypothetical protein